jgi:DNA-binding response OmpR family regulator
MPIQKILILDDDPDLLSIMDYLLTSEGYKTLSLQKGDHIKEHIVQFCPDLILMDVMLAEMDGREICKLLKADQTFKTPVILISGTHDLNQVMFAIGAPNDFVPKPFDIDQLLLTIEQQLS